MTLQEAVATGSWETGFSGESCSCRVQSSFFVVVLVDLCQFSDVFRSKLSPHRFVIVLAGNPNKITHSLGGTEARETRAACLLSFFLQNCLSSTVIFFPLWKAHFVRLVVEKTLQVLLGLKPSYTNFCPKRPSSCGTCLCFFVLFSCRTLV